MVAVIVDVRGKGDVETSTFLVIGGVLGSITSGLSFLGLASGVD